MLALSVKSSGLGDCEELTQDGSSGNAWGDAMGRHSVWEDDEEY